MARTAAGTPDLFIDTMHPNRAGYTIVAEVLADNLLGRPVAPAMVVR